ncbi:MAG: amidohydrolase [Saprospiraceae bacterium]|nr:amidohydrolase [Saprospiraceae bacterium]
MSMLKEKIKALAKTYHADVIALRRHLHINPELSFEEVETGKFVAQQLQNLNIPFEHGIAENGVVGLIKGKNPDKKVIALRADFDALPILEANDVPYKSQKPGVMHACGHDAHTSSLLGAARILNDIKHDFEGTIKLIFQPAEERTPGGASIMIKEGVLENPKPLSILGQHVQPSLETGKVGLKGGIYMASSDELYITVRGKGGHGAMPQDCVDTIVIAAHIITALQQIVSRNADPSVPTVLTLGKINSTGGATNVIPDEVKIEGTFRTLDETWRAEAKLRMKKMAEGIAEAMGGSCELIVQHGYPVLFNDELLTQKVKNQMIEFCGEENVVDLPLRMTSEDFAYFSQSMPACFYRLGTGNRARGITSGLHTDTFDIDEKSLELSIGLLAWLAIKELEN